MKAEGRGRVGGGETLQERHVEPVASSGAGKTNGISQGDPPGLSCRSWVSR